MIADEHDFAFVFEIDGDPTVYAGLNLADAPFGPRGRPDEVACFKRMRHIELLARSEPVSESET